MKQFTFDIVQALQGDEDFILATIVRHAGSSPRTTGARMIVRKDGSISGTIGGGLLEAQVIQEAIQTLAARSCRVRSYHFDARQAGDLGMICGGQVDVLFQYVQIPDPDLENHYRRLGEALETGRKAWSVTRLLSTSGQAEGEVAPLQWLVADGPSGLELTGRPDADLALLGKATASVTGKDPRWVQLGKADYLVEPVHAQGTAVIFGAGHISQMLAPLAGWVGFNTIVLDDRPEFANRKRFAAADQVIAVDSYEQALEKLVIGPDSYLIIVTRGHKDDLAVLDLALRTKAGYIGMIGSKRKRDLVYQALKASGVSQQELDRVHSPIGLTIGAETPEEIAISILAELIQARASKSG